MEKFKQNPREYRDNLAKTIKEVKKIDPDSANMVLQKEKEKDTYIESEELIRFQVRLEKEINNFKHGKFNTHKVEQSVNTEEIKKLGYDVEKDVYVLLGSSDGFELLKAIDNELKEKNKLKVYIINEDKKPSFSHYHRYENVVSELPVPFKGLSLVRSEDPKGGVYETYKNGMHKGSIHNRMLDAINKVSGETLDNIDWYNNQKEFKIINELEENRCNLTNDWIEYLKNNSNKIKYESEDYTTTDISGLGDTRYHSRLVGDYKKQTEDLFKEFLKEHNVELILTSNKVGDYSKMIPVATDSYYILINKGEDSYRYGGYWGGSEEKKQSVLYIEKVALEILSRPKSIIDEKYNPVKEWEHKLKK